MNDISCNALWWLFFFLWNKPHNIPKPQHLHLWKKIKSTFLSTKTLIGQVDTTVGASQLPWGIEAPTSIKYTNINLGRGWEGKEGTQRLLQESENDCGPPSFVKGTVLLATSHQCCCWLRPDPARPWPPHTIHAQTRQKSRNFHSKLTTVTEMTQT